MEHRGGFHPATLQRAEAVPRAETNPIGHGRGDVTLYSPLYFQIAVEYIFTRR